MKKLAIILAFIGIVFSPLLSHPWKPAHYVIIDTDGGADDMKALTMFLASPNVRVLAVTVSPGVLSAENAYIKVRSLLNSYRHEGIPVGINRIGRYKPAEFPVARKSVWGDENNIDPEKAPDCFVLINDILNAEKTKITFVSLGSMSTAYRAFTTLPLFRQQVNSIVWSADGVAEKDGFNYNLDKDASVMMIRQDVKINVVRKVDLKDSDFYDKETLEKIKGIKTIYGKMITSFFESEPGKSHKFSFSGTDEMVPVFMHYPDLFVNRVAGNVSYSAPADLPGLREAVIKILSGKTVAENQLIKEIPEDYEFYFDDIKPYVSEIIEAHGRNEWISGVLASELHRHLGVFAIIGVKMGIRAREYFNTGVDEFSVVSYAGSVPPLSCMNDGIQVSTGATPGHGLLTVRNDTMLRPTAEFSYLNRKIRISLKPHIAEIISSELKEINFIYGLDSDIYWELVRKNTIKYWRTFSRFEIFDIEEVR
ncbi:MAG: nucleoside hydrolase [Bacteroidales bacterium]|nr:nucleoside hydrolase [Bacteroidales bacterium]